MITKLASHRSLIILFSKISISKRAYKTIDSKWNKILSDRSAYSSVAYRVWKRISYEKIYQLNDIAVGGFWPEKVVLLDIDPLVSLDRQKVADRIGSDKIEFFQNIRKGYLRLSEEFSESF